MARRASMWTLSLLNTAAAAGAQLLLDLGAALKTSRGISSLSGFTLTRMIINLTYKPTLVGSGHIDAFTGIIRI